jgi:hypothetical protein
MNTELHTVYVEERAANPHRSATDALRAARYRLKMRGVEIPKYAGDSVRIELPRGEYIVCALEHDDDADISERLQCEIDHDRDARDAADNGAADGWISRDGRVLFDANGPRSGYAWAWWISDCPLRERLAYARRSMARHDAWLCARREVADAFDYFREVQEAGYVGYVVTLYDADGEEVEAESVWGYEAEGDYAGQEARHEADAMADARAKYWEAETEKARERARSIRATVRDLIGDLRKARGADLPHACAALRGHLANMRTAHRAAVAVIAGGAE